MRCPRCPVAPDRRCPGEDARRVCDLVDPAHPDYDPRYRETIPFHARPRFPTAQQQAANLARALWDWAISGFAMASDEEKARRRGICAACPRWAAESRRCVLCGCYTDAKIALKTEHCPDDPPRW